MNTINDRADISRILMQMRDMQARIEDSLPASQEPAQLPDVGISNTIQGSNKAAFGQLLKSAVESVNETQMQAASMQRAYELGDESVDLTQVMIQMQKASISFEAMTQVRNKVVSAYQEIMNMPI